MYIFKVLFQLKLFVNEEEIVTCKLAAQPCDCEIHRF